MTSSFTFKFKLKFSKQGLITSIQILTLEWQNLS